MRAVLGAIASVLYGWRIYDPKGSYAAFYDASNWLTGQVLAEGGAWSVVRNIVNLVLLDQADGFLLGIVFLSIISLPLWGIRVSGRWCVRKVKAIRQRRREQRERSRTTADAPPLVLRDIVDRPRLLRDRV